MNPRKPLVALAVASALALAACGSAPDETTNDDKHIKGMDRANAFSLCKQKTEQQLKSPSTADFQSILDATIEQSDDKGQWVIRTHVDSENGFGANVRSEVVCTIQPEGPDKGRVQAIVN